MLGKEDLEVVAELIHHAVNAAKQEVYREIADSLKEAGEQNLYDHESIEEQAGKAGCRLAGDRISWLVES